MTFTSGQTWQVYPNWPSGHPDAPALETQDTFDGTGQVVKHVNHVRHDDSYADLSGEMITYVMSDTTTTTYYLHSTVLGGKTIAELDQNGAKMKGYVYAGGARVATQTVNGGSNTVQLGATNPVTGAAITTDANGTYAKRQEPDPLGRELAQAPDPTIAVDPLSSSKWNDPMPIEYSPQWTGEMESGMSRYVDTMDMIVAREAYTRWLKSERTSNTDYNIWRNILNKNPNVGVSNGKKTLWGSDATDYLQRHSGSIFLGDNGEIYQRKGGRILLIVGDKGLNRHNVGDAFDRVAATKKSELEDEGAEVIVQRASSAADFANAMISNGMLDGVEYIGHASNNALFVGEQPGTVTNPTNLDIRNYRMLSEANLNPNAYIKLNGCNAGRGDYISIARSIALWLHRSVGTFDGPTHFYGRPDAKRTSPRPGERPPARGPLYLLEDRGTHFVIIRPD